MDTGKKSKLLFYIISGLAVLAIVACFIVNLVVSKGLTWALYPFVGIIFAWLVALPFFFIDTLGKKILLSLASFSVFLLPLLFILQFLTPIKSWFSPLGLPIGIIIIVCVWVSYLLVKKLSGNKWVLSGSMAFLYIVLAATLINFFAMRFLGYSFVNLQLFINLISGLAITGLLFFIAYSKRNDKPGDNTKNNNVE